MGARSLALVLCAGTLLRCGRTGLLWPTVADEHDATPDQPADAGIATPTADAMAPPEEQAPDSGHATLDSPDGDAKAPVDSSLIAAEEGSPEAAADAFVEATSPPPPDFAWYRLDETSGTTAHDSSPNHYDITNLDGVAWSAGAIFDGATVCGSTTVGQGFRSAPVTMTAWVQAVLRSDETLNDHALTPFPPNALSGDAPALGGFGLGLNVWTDASGGSGMGIETGENAAIAFHTVGTFQAGVPYFVVLAIAPTQATLYVNGASSAVVSANTPLAQSPAPLHLGCHNDDTQYGSKRFFKGRLRDARIYLRLLASDEIAQLFADGPW